MWLCDVERGMSVIHEQVKMLRGQLHYQNLVDKGVVLPSSTVKVLWELETELREWVTQEKSVFYEPAPLKRRQQWCLSLPKLLKKGSKETVSIVCVISYQEIP